MEKMNDKLPMAFYAEIPGRPVPKARPRVYGRHAVTPKKTASAEAALRSAIRAEIAAGRLCVRVPNPAYAEARDRVLKRRGAYYPKPAALDVHLSFNFAPPRSESKKTKEGMLADEILPTVKPDVDNLAKLVLDALNGLVYEDDAQIVKLTACKTYANTDSTVIRVHVIGRGKS